MQANSIDDVKVKELPTSLPVTPKTLPDPHQKSRKILEIIFIFSISFRGRQREDDGAGVRPGQRHPHHRHRDHPHVALRQLLLQREVSDLMQIQDTVKKRSLGCINWGDDLCVTTTNLETALRR